MSFLDHIFTTSYLNYSLSHQVAVPGGSNVTTAFAELFDSTPGTPASLQASTLEAVQGGELAYNLEHMRRRLTT